MDVGFYLGSPVNWARREAQVEMMVSTVEEGHQAITDTICGQVWSVLVTAASDSPVRVPGKDSIGVHGGG